MDDDVAKKRAFMGNWVREIKWNWDGNLHARRESERCGGSASTITLHRRIRGIFTALASRMQSIARTKTQIN